MTISSEQTTMAHMAEAGSQTRIPGLDGIRAIAVVMVMLSHYGFGHLVPGGLGVTIFFFLSGFLITTLMVAEHDQASTINIRHFYARRFLRLLPEMFAMLAISSVLGLVYLKRLPTVLDVSAALLYFTNYAYIWSHQVGFELRWPHLWSLAVEEHYYLTYPLLFSVMIKRPRVLIATLATITVAVLAWRTIALTGLHFSGHYTYVASEARIDTMAYGCILALWRRFRGQPLFTVHPLLNSASLGAGLCLMLATLLFRDPVFRETLRYSLQSVALVLIFQGLLPNGRPGITVKLLDLPPLRWMGRMSYGAYLWHLEVLGLMFLVFPNHQFPSTLPGKLAAAAGGTTAAFAIAALSYRLVYQNVVGLRRRFGSHNV